MVATPTSASKPRWYRVTPDRFLLALLAVEVLLFLSEQFCWFPFNQHKGWTVLIAVAPLGVAMLVMLVWLSVSVLLRRRFQFSIRSLLVFVLICAVVCSWLAVEMERGKRQAEVVAAIQESGGSVLYDYEELQELDERSPGPDLLHRLLGEKFFAYVTAVDWTRATDCDLEHLGEFTQLEGLNVDGSQVTDAGMANLEGLKHLDVLSLEDTQVTDVGLDHVKGLRQLRLLYLARTQVTDEGVKRLHQALPNCQINR